MAQVVGVRFKSAGKLLFYSTAGLEVAVGERVVAETERGLELGWVTLPPQEKGGKEAFPPLTRKAIPEDLEQAHLLERQAQESLDKARERVGWRGLEMRFLAAEYNLEASRLTFYFSAPARVDFRELVRELAGLFHIRIEMRQVGPRDETKLLGGMGPCGLSLCCHRWLTEFSSVSIRMAKEQDLSLNPLKISGVCGRLLCCLGYEMEQYLALKEKLPPRGQRVSTPLGPSVVVGGNPLKESVTVELESGAVVEIPLSQVTLEPEPSAPST